MKKFAVCFTDYCDEPPLAICKTRADAEEFLFSMVEEWAYEAMLTDIHDECAFTLKEIHNIEEWFTVVFKHYDPWHMKNWYGEMLYDYGESLIIHEVEELD